MLQKSSSSVNNPYGTDFQELVFSYNQIGAGLHVTISPKGMTRLKRNHQEPLKAKFFFRYRPPININDSPTLASSDKLNLITKNDSIFSFQVQRDRTGVNIWDTSIGGLLFADKYLQIATLLPSDKIYGFGENIHQNLQV